MTEPLPEWEFVSHEWTEPTDPKVAGWNVDDVVVAERATWPSFIDVLNSTQPLGVHGVSTIPDLFTHNVNMTYGYVLALAAQGRPALTILDWGCGLGQHYAIARTLWPNLSIQYTGVDLPKACEAAKQLSPEAKFVADTSWQAQKYAFVMANGSLHYNKCWQDVLADLVKATDGYLLVTQLPIVSGAPYVYVQRPYVFGYNTEYISWALNGDEFVLAAQAAGAELVREFIAGLRPPVVNAPEPFEYRGYLFKH